MALTPAGLGMVAYHGLPQVDADERCSFRPEAAPSSPRGPGRSWPRRRHRAPSSRRSPTC